MSHAVLTLAVTLRSSVLTIIWADSRLCLAAWACRRASLWSACCCESCCFREEMSLVSSMLSAAVK